MKHWTDGIKKRRKERLRHLGREAWRNAASRNDDEARTPFYSSYLSEYQANFPRSENDFPRRSFDGPRLSSPRKWLVQTMFSVVLLGLVYAIFQWNVPLGEKIRPFVSEVLERDFNFDGMAAWYQDKFGDNLTILPALAIKDTKGEAVWAQVNFTSPAQGVIIMPFYKDGQGVWIGLKKGNRVSAADEGWVVFSGSKEGFGKTVVIRHRHGVETWYAQLAEIQVKKNAWVQSGETIGTVAMETVDVTDALQENEKEGMLYFALRADGRFVDPAGVIPFE